jgi:hypothetical protein
MTKESFAPPPKVMPRTLVWLRRFGFRRRLRLTGAAIGDLRAVRRELVREAERFAEKEAKNRGWDVGIMLHEQLPAERRLGDRVQQKAAALSVYADQREVFAKALLAAGNRVQTARERRDRAVTRREELAAARAAVVAQIRGGPR